MNIIFYPMFAQVSEGLYISNLESVTDLNLRKHNINVVINLSGKHCILQDCVKYNFVLPGQELMENEVPKIIRKLNEITNLIDILRKESFNVLIMCYDGLNKSPLVAGYYLIKNGKKYNNLINTLEEIYFTNEQRAPESKKSLAAQDHSTMSLREERNAIRALHFKSFKKILRDLDSELSSCTQLK